MAAILQANQTVGLAALREPNSIAPARVLDSSGNCVRLEIATSLPPGSLVKLEWNDALALGQVIEAYQNSINIEIEHLIEQAGAIQRRNRIWWHTGTDQVSE